MRQRLKCTAIITLIIVLAGCSSEIQTYENKNLDYFVLDNYVGKTYEDVADETAGILEIEEIRVYSSEQDAGVIINQYPYAGKETVKDSDMTLYVSNGASPDGLMLNGLKLSRAEEILKQAGSAYTVEYVYNLNVQNGYVFGLGQSGDNYIIYTSLGQPELNVSSVPGYVTESSGYIFYTDDRHIFRMNPDGSTKRTLVDARSLQEIIPYDDWIVYHDIESKALHIVNWEDGKKSTEISNVDLVFKVIDDMVYFEDDDGLKKYSLSSGNMYYVVKLDNNSSIYNVVYNNNNLYFRRLYKTKDGQLTIALERLNCFTGEKVTLDDKNEVYEIYYYDNSIYYTNVLGLHLLDESRMQGKLIANFDYTGIYSINDDKIIIDTSNDNLVYSYNLASGQKTELCDYSDLLWIDSQNDWVYFIKDNATYRKKSNELGEEFFSQAIILSGYYTKPSFDSIPSIDGWLYFFDSDNVLSRINIETKVVEHVAGNPTDMPWWAKI